MSLTTLWHLGDCKDLFVDKPLQVYVAYPVADSHGTESSDSSLIEIRVCIERGFQIGPIQRFGRSKNMISGAHMATRWHYLPSGILLLLSKCMRC